MGRKKAIVIAFVDEAKNSGLRWGSTVDQDLGFFRSKNSPESFESKITDRNVVRDSSKELRIIS